MDCVDFSPFTLSPPLQRGEEPTAAQRKVANQLDDCFRNFGALYLTNIGITKEELAESFDVMKTLFAMPEEDKLEKLKPLEQVTNTGYLRSGCESLNPRRSPDMKEAYNFGCPIAFPQDFNCCPPGFSDFISELWSKFKTMADKFSIACAIALGLPTHYFLDGMQKMELCRIRFIHYPPCDFVSNQNAKEAATSAIRVGEHTDFGTFTFLFTDSPGLQMKPACGGEANGSSDKAWTDIPLPESKNVSAIVNTGAVFARYTNDKWKAAAHRVIIKDADVAKRSRYSLAGFYGPDREVPVEVIPKLLAPGEKPNFDSMTSLEYVNVRLKAAQKL